MVGKAERYWLLRVLLPLVAVGGIVVLYGGLARGVVLWPPGPSGSTGVIALALGAGAVAYGAVNALNTRALGSAGKAAGLSANGLGALGRPTLSGQRRGRPVEARVLKDTDSASSRRGKEEKLFTVVATTLDQPAT